jgi:hypothetical protein
VAGAGAPLSRWAPAVLVLLCALAAAGAGPFNGDAAVYAHQAMRGDLSDRVVHVGWVALAACIFPLVGDALPWVLDMVVGGAAACGVALVCARSGGVAGWCAAAVVLPVCAFAEVDLPWAVLVLAAAVAPPGLASLAAAAAVAVSPTALLALPWAALHRRDPWPVVGGVGAVIALSLGSSGGWWIGERGVLTAAPPRPWGAVGAWGRAPWWLVVPAARMVPAHAALSLLLLAPADVPAWCFVGLALSLSVDGHTLGRSRLRWGWLASVVGVAVVALWVNRAQVVRVNQDIQEMAAMLTPSDAIEAPWTIGVRVSLALTGDPYALMWRSPTGFVRDQRRRWCEDGPERAARVVSGELVWDRASREGCESLPRPGGRGAP